MIKFFKNKKKEKLAKEKLAQQQAQANEAEKTANNPSPDTPESGSNDVGSGVNVTAKNETITQPSQADTDAVAEEKNREEQSRAQQQVEPPQNNQAVNQTPQNVEANNTVRPVHEKLGHEPPEQPIHEQTTQEVPVYNAAATQSATEVKETPSKSVNALDDKLEKSNKNFGKKMKQLFSFKKKIDEELFEDIETTLLMADVGATATMDVMEKVRKSIKRKNLSDADAVYDALKMQLGELAAKVEQPLHIDTEKQPFVILVVGVNGVGKTTTIAKLAKKYKSDGKKVMLAAGDTFRAAAVEQLKTWGQREDIPVMAQNTGADSASVIFDAMTSAKSKGMDILIADTAGRLHTQANLMQELEKIGRVMRKNDETAPHETLIVVDGGTGQNAISQVREFNKAGTLTGIVITKLDGTAKGGVLFNLAAEFGIPVRYIGVGEQSVDLKPYHAKDFVDAIVG